MSMQQVSKAEITSSTSYVDLQGIYDYNPYLLVITGLEYVSDTYSRLQLIAQGGSVYTSSNYNWSYAYFRSDTSNLFSQSSGNNAFDIGSTSASGNSYNANMVVYLHNMLDFNLYPTIYSRMAHRQNNASGRGFSCYGMIRVNGSFDGVRFFGHASNFDRATLTLYRIG